MQLSNFDPVYYLNKYPDLRAAGISTGQAAISHYNRYGKAEGRQINGKKILHATIEGGFGNQLFMIFNIIALSKKFNKEFLLSYKKNYARDYNRNNGTTRKESSEYKLLEKLTIQPYHLINFKDFRERGFQYTPIRLNNNDNYFIKGYFQSYKYFWNERDEIKKNLNIDYSLIDDIKATYANYNGKKILGIHMRLGDYVSLEKNGVHIVLPISYYEKELSSFDLEEYKIILFSDNPDTALQKLKHLELDITNANEFYTGDEEQFYMLMLTNARIIANSSFSLMSCYMTEMYQFVENVEYRYPDKWFGPIGPTVNFNDIIIK